jgi:hypothetical protein
MGPVTVIIGDKPVDRLLVRFPQPGESGATGSRPRRRSPLGNLHVNPVGILDVETGIIAL